MLTVYGVVVLTFMMLMYACEGRGPGFVLAFAVGCALSSSYGFASGAWPFGVVEAIWAVIALRRFIVARRAAAGNLGAGAPGSLVGSRPIRSRGAQ